MPVPAPAHPSRRAKARPPFEVDACPLLSLFPAIFHSPSLGLQNVRLRIFTPLVTVILAIAQQLHHSACRNMVLRLIGLRAANGLTVPSASTAAFCKAKLRLPLGLIEELIAAMAAAAVKGVGKRGLWRGHRVKLLDGTSFAMTDTPANRARWPQPDSQKPGLGFPQMRIVALFSLATGAILSWAGGTYKDGEPTLARRLLSALEAGDIVVRDRAFAGYAFICELLANKVHTITRLPGRVKRFKPQGKHGATDRIVHLQRPKAPSTGYTEEEWNKLPAMLALRFIDVQVAVPGFRTQFYTLVTTLLDEKKYPREELADLYLARWQVEVDFLHIKTTMKAEMLRGRSPAAIERELRFVLLAYNVVRAVMVQAAAFNAAEPRRMSFAGARAAITELESSARDHRISARRKAIEAVLEGVASQPVPLRPNRSEPRAVKRRRKDYPRLRCARKDWKERPHRNRIYSKAKKMRLAAEKQAQAS